MSDLHISGQTTQKYDIPLNHLEYSYIEKCSDVKELEKILRVLRSGDEGRYPDLESFTERRLEGICPKSRALRRDAPISRPSDLASGDWKNIEQDLKNWSSEMSNKDKTNHGRVAKKAQSEQELCEGDENLPPIRSSNIIIEGNKRKEATPVDKPKKKVVPREYKDWDKIDIDEELKKADETNAKTSNPSRKLAGKDIPDQIDTAGLTEEEKERKANREKDKGNEAYRSGDYDESITYYSRSISLLPLAASFNNRALAYLKLEKWEAAVKDCTKVLSLETDNVKALLRRGTAYKSNNQLRQGKADFEKVLALEPNNKKAESLLQDVDVELEKQDKKRKEKGRRMVIEEVNDSEGEEGDGGVEEIQVEKPMVNGFGHHGKTNGGEKKEKKEAASKLNSGAKESKSTASNPGSVSSKKSSKIVKDTTKDTTKDTKDSAKCSNDAKGKKSSSGLPASSDKDNTSSASLPGQSDQPQQEQKPAAAMSPLSNQTPAQATSVSSSSSTSSSDNRVPPVSSLSSSSSSPSSSAAEPSPPSSEGSLPPSPSFDRPVFVHLPLPTHVSKLKEDGNNLFKSGQYSSAIQLYSKAIGLLEKDSSQCVNTSLVLSNRAACHLKTGSTSEAVKDCNSSLALVPHSLKSLLRRAQANEMLEKYGHAYVDYKHALSIDHCVDQATQGASRCQRVLTELHGQRLWREKIPPLVFVQPWEVPIIQDPSSSSSSTPSSNQSPSPSLSSSSVAAPPPPVQPKEAWVPPSPAARTDAQPDKPKQAESVKAKEPSGPTKQERFEQMKAAGNSHVQKGAYSEAEKCYSSCIGLCPDQVACYTNRALCYIKLNKATEAEGDCDKALSLQPGNPKALYRRALARKSLQRYKLSMQDLLELLKLEPKNKAASAEMDIVKQYYKEELEQLKQKKQEADSAKVRKRMKIEEVEDEEEEEKPGRSKAQVKSQSKTRGAKSSSQAPTVVKSKGSTHQTASESAPSQGGGGGVPVAPPSAPRLMKTTPYEFCQAWNSLKPNQGIQPYAEILRQVSPPDLPSVISNKLDGQMLQIIVRCVYEEMVLKGEVDQGYQILDYLCKVPRFSTVSMFMSSKEKKEVSSVLDILAKTGSKAYSKLDIQRLKKDYSVK